MSTFVVALYAGGTLSTARILAASSDPELVRIVATRLLREQKGNEEAEVDPATAALDQGRVRALKLAARQAKSQPFEIVSRDGGGPRE